VVVGQSSPTHGGFVNPHGEDRGPHGTVEKEDPFFQELHQLRSDFVSMNACHVHMFEGRWSIVKC
jgi:hypothetical protein